VYAERPCDCKALDFSGRPRWLICGKNALLSSASVATDLAIKAVLIRATIAAFVLMMRAPATAGRPRAHG
jgi:hypothetical protein